MYGEHWISTGCPFCHVSENGTFITQEAFMAGDLDNIENLRWNKVSWHAGEKLALNSQLMDTIVCFLLGWTGWTRFGSKIDWAKWFRVFSSQTFSRINTPTFLKPSSFFTPTFLWRWNRHSVPKRRHIKFRRRGITQKEPCNIQNKAKVWNQECRLTLR
jgi:hypothetical protein